jgi:hypothetical protein
VGYAELWVAGRWASCNAINRLGAVAAWQRFVMFPFTGSDASFGAQVVFSGAGYRVIRRKYGTAARSHYFSLKNADKTLLEWVS